MWNDSDDSWTKLGTIATIIGTIIAIYIAVIYANRERNKSIRENSHYKISLLHDLEGMLGEIFKAVHISIRRENGDISDNDHITLQDSVESFTYWASRISNINSNVYVPPEIRDIVSMFLHQGIKPITFNGTAAMKQFTQTTVFDLIDRITESPYMMHDKDRNVQHFRNMVKDTRKSIERLYSE